MHNQGDSDDDVGENNDNDGHDGNDVGCIYSNGDFRIEGKKEARFERNLNFKYFGVFSARGVTPLFGFFIAKNVFRNWGGYPLPPVTKSPPL